jgi:putative copper export protein
MSPNRYDKELRVLGEIMHLTHVVLAGVWLGGLAFTTLVVSPALKAMKWPEAERVAVRSAIGRQYARVGGINLVLIALFALLDGALGGFGPALYAEYALIFVLFGLVAAHGAYFGRRLAELARAELESENEEAARTFAVRRRSLQEISSRVSWVNLLVSTAVVVLATG